MQYLIAHIYLHIAGRHVHKLPSNLNKGAQLSWCQC